MKAKHTFFLLLCPLFFAACGSDFEGIWQCKDNESETLTINKIGSNTYELEFGSEMSFSGEVNDDGVLVVEMMGNVSRLSLDGGELRFSGVLAPCKLLKKK